MDTRIQQFFMALPDHKKEIAMIVRDTVLAVSPEVKESIKWNQLTFGGKKDFAFIYTRPQAAYMNLGFFFATSLNDPKKLFEGTGKGMRHIKIYTPKDIPASQIKKWVEESLSIVKVK